MNSVDYKIKTVKTKQTASDFLDSRSMLFDENGEVNVIYSIITLSDKFIGRVRLCETKFSFYETHAVLKDDYCGFGLGSKLYIEAIKYALNKNITDIRSSTHPTLSAIRVWEGKTLNEQFLIKKIGKRYRILGQK